MERAEYSNTSRRAMIANSMIYSMLRYWAQFLTIPEKIMDALDSDAQALVTPAPKRCNTWSTVLQSNIKDIWSTKEVL